MSADRRFFCIVWLLTWLIVWVGSVIAGMNSAEAVFAAFPVGWTAAILLAPHRERLASAARRFFAWPVVRTVWLFGYLPFTAYQFFQRGVAEGDRVRTFLGTCLLVIYALFGLIVVATALRNRWVKKAGVRPARRRRGLTWLP